ncbi:MAG: MFS transporter [Planctomycetota bacterium]|nr:MFS transporter [Planctomycetota bacterium]
MASDSHRRRRSMISGVLGNLLEWYDFTVYGFFAVTIGRVLLGSGDDGGTLEALAIFAIGFIARPFGGAVLGSIADRFGRRRALMLSVLGIIVPTFLIALLPTHQQIGALSGILLLLLRLLQGIAVGGEFTGSMVFLSELASRGHRGLATGCSVATAMAGILLGGLVYTLLSSLMEPAALETWGWRIAFLLGAVLGLVTWFLLQSAEETEGFVDEAATESPVLACLRDHWRTMLRCVMVLALPAAWCYAVTVFVVVVLHHRLGNDAVFAGAMGSIAAGIPIVCTPLFGAISDRVGRRPVVLGGSIAALLLAIPILALVDHAATGVVVLAVSLGGVVLAVLQGGTAVALVEQFPDRVRATGTGLAYNVTYAVAGGTQPLLALWLVDVTGSYLAPGGVLMVLAVLSLVALRWTPETAFDDQA